jgi:hypothetical protein
LECDKSGLNKKPSGKLFSKSSVMSPKPLHQTRSAFVSVKRTSAGIRGGVLLKPQGLHLEIRDANQYEIGKDPINQLSVCDIGRTPVIVTGMEMAKKGSKISLTLVADLLRLYRHKAMNRHRNVRYKYLQKRPGNSRTVVDDDSAAQLAAIGCGTSAPADQLSLSIVASWSFFCKEEN